MKKEKWWEGLEKKPVKRCFKCDRPRSYMNPLDKCAECLQFFCYDHVYGNQVNKKMKITDEVKVICEECGKKHGYRTL